METSVKNPCGPFPVNALKSIKQHLPNVGQARVHQPCFLAHERKKMKLFCPISCYLTTENKFAVAHNCLVCIQHTPAPDFQKNTHFFPTLMKTSALPALLLALAVSACGPQEKPGQAVKTKTDWQLGPFVKHPGNPCLESLPNSTFYCPVRKTRFFGKKKTFSIRRHW